MEIFLVTPRPFHRYPTHYVLVMFVVGLLDENEVVVDVLEVHVLLVEHLNLAKISWIPRLY